MERRQLEDFWQRRVADAAERYRTAAEELQRVLQEPSGAPLTADASVKIRLARQTEFQARAEYMRTLRVLTDLVTKGIIPKEAASAKAGVGGSQDGAAPYNGSAGTSRFEPVVTPLTRREREVLALLAAGRTSKEISTELGITFKTTACHRNRIMAKLACRNVADLTRAAVRMGLVEP